MEMTSEEHIDYGKLNKKKRNNSRRKMIIVTTIVVACALLWYFVPVASVAKNQEKRILIANSVIEFIEERLEGATLIIESYSLETSDIAPGFDKDVTVFKLVSPDTYQNDTWGYLYYKDRGEEGSFKAAFPEEFYGECVITFFIQTWRISEKKHRYNLTVNVYDMGVYAGELEVVSTNYLYNYEGGHTFSGWSDNYTFIRY